jgi:integrase
MANRNDNGEGSCRPIKSGRLEGKWRVQFILEDTDGTKKRISRVFPSQKEGKDFLRTLKRSDEVAAIHKVKELTFGEWFMWLAENDWPETLDPKTIRDRVARYKKFASDRWAGIPLTKIDPLDVKMFYKKLAEDGVGEHTRIALKAGLVRAFNQAITPYRRVPHFWSNPFCLDMPAPERRQAVAITPQQAKKALASPDLDDKRRAMLGVFLLAGFRLGEQMALTRGQLDMENGLILVDRAVKLDGKSSQVIGLPKGDKVRTAVMCETLKRLLEPIIEGLEPDDYVWPNATDNKPRMKTLVYATWRRIRKEAGLPEDMSPHDCRLSHINWIEKLCPEVSTTTLKEHVGHSADGVTEVNYTRPMMPAQDILRKALDGLMTSV